MNRASIAELARFLVAALLFALVACGPLITETSPETQSTSARWLAAGAVKRGYELDGLMRYFAYVNHLPKAGLRQEYALTLKELAEDQSAFNRMRLALIAVVPGADFVDEARALSLLEPLVRPQQGGDTGLTDLAALLATVIMDRRKANSDLQSATQNFKDEKRRTELVQQKLMGEVQAVTQRLRDEQMRADALQKKIDELKVIEKTMAERPYLPSKKP
jgi:hypothetical protein